MIEVSD